MSASDPKSWGDQIVGFSVGCLIAAVALYCAVSVIEAIWPVLVVIVGVISLGAAVIAIVRWRQSRW